jgi:VWFA-related protein
MGATMNTLLRRSVYVLAIAFALLAAAARLHSQSPSQGVPAPTIRVSTRLVLVDVVVTDKQGKPVSGLKAEDFTIEEKGKKQKIAVFQTPEEAQQQNTPTQLGPGLYTNRPEFRSPGGPLTVLLLDAANTPFQDQAYSRQQMLKYVSQQAKPGTRMGVFTLTNSLQVLQDFTDDPEILLAALKKYQPQEPILQNGVPPPISAGAQTLGARQAATVAQVESIAQGFQSVQMSYALDRRVDITLNAMRSLARILGGIPGRKNIVWLTAAFPFELIPQDRNVSEAELVADLPNIQHKNVDTIATGSVAATQRQSYAPEIRQAAAELSTAQVAIYPVDVRGLISGAEFMREDSANRQSSNTSERAIVRMSDVTASQETMKAVAEETGGKVYINQNEVAVGVALAVQDNAASYTIGYYPEDKKWDGKYRSIKVKLARDGLQLRHRRGYFGIDPSQQKDRKPEQQVAEALRDNAPSTLVTFSAQVKPGEKGKLAIAFLVDANSLSAEDVSGGKKLSFAYYAALFSPEGKMLENRSQKAEQTFKEDVYRQVLQQGILLHLDLDSKLDKGELRLAVQDLRTGMVGTIDAPMSLP